MVSSPHLSNPSASRNGFYFICLISLSFKIALAATYQSMNPDGVLYLSAAEQYSQGHFIEGLRLYPLFPYPLLIAAVRSVAGDLLLAARMISIAATVLTLFPLYRLTERWFGRDAAIWACLLFALLPVSNTFALNVIRGPVFLLFFSWAIYWFCLALDTGLSRHVLLSSMFFWFSTTFRIEGALVTPFFLVLLYFFKRSENPDGRQGLRLIFFWLIIPFLGGIVLLLGILVFTGSSDAGIIPFQFKNFGVFGLFEKYKTIYQHLEAAEKTLPYPAWGQNAIAVARHYLPLIYLIGSLESFLSNLSPVYFVPLFLGLKFADKNRRFPLLFLCGGYVFMIYLTHIWRDFVSGRFLYAPAFLLFPLIGFGMTRVLEHLRAGVGKKRFLWGFLITMIVFVPLAEVVQIPFKKDTSIQQAGLWIKQQVERSGEKYRILTTDQRVYYHSGSFSPDSISSYKNRRENARMVSRFLKEKNYAAIGKRALAKQSDVIIIRFPANQQSHLPEIPYFLLTKQFTGRKNITAVYVKQ